MWCGVHVCQIYKHWLYVHVHEYLSGEEVVPCTVLTRGYTLYSQHIHLHQGREELQLPVT